MTGGRAAANEPTGYVARKQSELAAKLAGLKAELTDWERLARPDGPLKKHHYQIKAVLGALAVPLEALSQRIDSAPAARWADIERTLLRCHEIWDFFRQKLALRQVDFFVPYLTLADEFTWACYEPARRRGAGAHNVPLDQVREPPLTFLNEIATPYAMPRGAPYLRGSVETVLDEDGLRAAVERLPVPVVGAPWFQLRHLPDMLVLGHEVGHHVETDFRLRDTSTRLLQNALAEADASVNRRLRWERWLPEVFADVYGLLATGPAFGVAMLDFAATGSVAAAGTRDYPPVRLRLAVVAHASVRGEDTSWRDSLLARWRTDFPADGLRAGEWTEAEAVGRTLVGSPYPEFGGATLAGVLDFVGWYETAEATAAALLKPSQLSNSIDIRCLLAASALAFARNPARYRAVDATSGALTHVPAIAVGGLRVAQPRTAMPARDEAAGRDLLALLSGGR